MRSILFAALIGCVLFSTSASAEDCVDPATPICDVYVDRPIVLRRWIDQFDDKVIYQLISGRSNEDLRFTCFDDGPVLVSAYTDRFLGLSRVKADWVVNDIGGNRATRALGVAGVTTKDGLGAYVPANADLVITILSLKGGKVEFRAESDYGLVAASADITAPLKSGLEMLVDLCGRPLVPG